MSKTRLDHTLIEKLATKLGRSKASLQSTISQFAGKYAISSEAALILLAKQNGIGTATYLKKLPANRQEQVRATLPAIFGQVTHKRRAIALLHDKSGSTTARQRSPLSMAIEYLIQDLDLRGRVSDLLKARGKFDRVFREATTVLDHKIKAVSGVKGNPSSLIVKALNPDPKKAVLVLSDEPSEQEGFFNICKGIFLAFRNATHHKLTEKFTREDALKFCGFVDSLLSAIAQAKVHRERAGN